MIKRKTVFVCSSVTAQGTLINKIISADNSSEAADLFFQQNNIKAQEILGPFYKKKVCSTDKYIKFTNKSNKAVYDNYLVNAFMLSEPENHAYLVFIKRIDDKKLPLPKGTIVVPLSDLRLL